MGRLGAIAPKTVFLTLGSSKGCQGYRETKMRNGGRVLLAVQNLCVRIKIRVAIFDTDHSVTPDSCTWNLLQTKKAWCVTFRFFYLIMILIFYFLK